MTIETRRSSHLPWKFPYNTRELKPGGTVCVNIELAEGLYSYKLTALDKNTAITETTLPVIMTDAGIVYDPETTKAVIEKKEINSYGPGEKSNWRWRP